MGSLPHCLQVALAGRQEAYLLSNLTKMACTIGGSQDLDDVSESECGVIGFDRNYGVIVFQDFAAEELDVVERSHLHQFQFRSTAKFDVEWEAFVGRIGRNYHYEGDCLRVVSRVLVLEVPITANYSHRSEIGNHHEMSNQTHQVNVGPHFMPVALII